MYGRLALPWLLAVLVGAGCSIDREGLLVPEPARADAGGVDCPPGTVDANGDPDDGCEYACTPTSPPDDVCDGMDNDCDPATEDGSDDPGIGVECDGGDDDLCPEGLTICTGGRTVCDDPTGNAREVCNGEDDDCDGLVDEDAEDATDWYLDRDADGWGGDESMVTQCDPPDGFADATGDCDDLDDSINPGATEICDTVDQNCNGIIDDAPGGCDCVGEEHDGTTYLFCRTTREWTGARDDCGGRSAHLVTIDDAPENDWVTGRCTHYGGANPWWIGLNDRGSEDDFEWVDGTPVGYTNWHGGEPNNGDASWLGGEPENCVELNRFTTPGTWNDATCDSNRYYVCEL